MSKIEDIVDALENKISKILHKQEALKQTNARLSNEIEQQQLKLKAQQEEIADWADKHNTLKMANSMLGSDENKRETKLKINALIRDIDHCIGQLSE
ncbi:hypothetical protein [uncultured Winogradskyella sp.]|uniref:hypothetical protein n=1 Tax=Winogradskyella sp. 4-2091 TaxID=3381659 RepID=UPI002635F71B|nr:hypothetical protein [uncultured Winogradskyella sp.]